MACALLYKYGCDFVLYLSSAYPAVYGQFPQAIPQPMSAVAPAQREGKDYPQPTLGSKRINHPPRLLLLLPFVSHNTCIGCVRCYPALCALYVFSCCVGVVDRNRSTHTLLWIDLFSGFLFSFRKNASS